MKIAPPKNKRRRCGGRLEAVYSGNTPKEEIDIILLTHGRLNDLTIPAVSCLYSHTRSPFHLIVVDDSTPDLPSGIEGTPDSTVEWFDKFQIDHNNVTFVHSSIPFKSGNQCFNVGLSHCRNRFAVIVMNSIQVEPDWDVVVVQMMAQNPKIGVIGLKCLKFGWGEKEDGQIECAGIGLSPADGFTPIDLGRNETSHRLCISVPRWSLQWAFVLLRKEAAVGNLDENLWEGFVGFDDIDDTLVLRSKGWEAWYCGLGVGYHRTHATRGGSTTNHIFKNRKNAEIFYKRWGMWDKYKAANPYTNEYFPNGEVKHVCNIVEIPLTVDNVVKTATTTTRKVGMEKSRDDKFLVDVPLTYEQNVQRQEESKIIPQPETMVQKHERPLVVQKDESQGRTTEDERSNGKVKGVTLLEKA